VPGDVGLALVEQLRELADAQLLLGREREQPQARGLGQDAVQLPSGRGGQLDVGHACGIYIDAYGCKYTGQAAAAPLASPS
jgi:hypothetical protein